MRSPQSAAVRARGHATAAVAFDEARGGPKTDRPSTRNRPSSGARQRPPSASSRGSAGSRSSVWMRLVEDDVRPGSCVTTFPPEEEVEAEERELFMADDRWVSLHSSLCVCVCVRVRVTLCLHSCLARVSFVDFVDFV